MKMKMNNNNLLVPFSIAEALKQIHFDKPTMFYYDTRKSFINEEGNLTYEIVFDHWRERDHNIIEGLISAPGYDQVFEWFREKEMPCYISYDGYDPDNLFFYRYHIFYENHYTSDYYGNSFYNEARKDAILHLIALYRKYIIKCSPEGIKEEKIYLSEYDTNLKYKINRFRNCVIRFFKDEKRDFIKEAIIFKSDIIKPIIKELENTYKKEDYEQSFILYEEPYVSLKKVSYKIDNLAESKLLKAIKKAIAYYAKIAEDDVTTEETRKDIIIENYNAFTISFPEWWFNAKLYYGWETRMKQYQEWGLVFDPRPLK
jgi:hypothetical protein